MMRIIGIGFSVLLAIAGWWGLSTVLLPPEITVPVRWFVIGFAAASGWLAAILGKDLDRLRVVEEAKEL